LKFHRLETARPVRYGYMPQPGKRGPQKKRA
jgi:hypothetical protein